MEQIELSENDRIRMAAARLKGWKYINVAGDHHVAVRSGIIKAGELIGEPADDSIFAWIFESDLPPIKKAVRNFFFYPGYRPPFKRNY